MKVPLTRRGFLGAAAVAPISAREVVSQARKALAKDIEAATGISTVGPHAWDFDVDSPHGEKTLDLLLRLGLPEWKHEELRREARQARTLDADIATLRSPSLSAKLRMQWDRNYDRAVAEYRSHAMWKATRRKWLKRYEISWF